MRKTKRENTGYVLDRKRQSVASRDGADVNFTSISSLDASNGWHVLRVSRDCLVTGDAAATNVLRQFFASVPHREGSLPVPLARTFFVSRDWGMRWSPGSAWRTYTSVQAGTKLFANFIPDGEGGYVVLKLGPLLRFTEGLDASLTRREQEIAAHVAAGKTNIEIGLLLDISARTVQKHLENIFRKLGVETRTALAMRFAR